MAPLFSRSLDLIGSERFRVDKTRTDTASPRAGRKWSVLAVLAVAVVLMMAVPLANRAFGGEVSYPGCGIAPWTGTCTCMMNENSAAMPYEGFANMLRRQHASDAEIVLATARRVCRLPIRSALRD
jgi:hypothetical protein